MATTTTTKKSLQITELDFDLIKESMQAYLRGQTEFTDYNFEGSGLSTLLDLLAYNTHYNAFYTNMIANEMFLDTATIRDSVVSLAKTLGYTPRSTISSKAEVHVEIQATKEMEAGVTALTIPKNSVFTTIVDNIAYNFVSTYAVVARQLTSGNALFSTDNPSFPSPIELKEGTRASIQYYYSASRRENFLIPNSSVDISTIDVVVTYIVSGTAKSVYELAGEYATIKSTDKVYFIQEGDEGKYEIYFGDGNVGFEPPDGSVIDISYLIASGPIANGARIFSANPVLSAVEGSVSYKPVVITVLDSWGGAQKESIESIKFLAPLNYEAQGRVVTKEDYKTRLLIDYPDLDAVNVWGGEEHVPPQYGTVYLSLKPKSGYVLSEASKNGIRDDILKTRNVVTINPILVDPDFLYLQLTSTVKWDSRLTTLSELTLARAIQLNIIEWAQDNLEKFETYFRHSQLLAKIDSFDDAVTNSLLTVRLLKEFRPKVGVMQDYTIKCSNALFHPHFGHQGAITSTSFQYGDFIGCRFDDLNGVLRIVRNDPATGVLTLIRENAGTVNYNNGEIVAQAFYPRVVDNGGLLKISAVPDVQDVIPLRNQLLTVRQEDVAVNLVDDTVFHRMAQSGTGVQVTQATASSYVSGAVGTTTIPGTTDTTGDLDY